MSGAVWTRLRIGLALAGFAVALLALAFEDHRLGWGAIALLAASLLIRLLARRAGTPDTDSRE
jgi:hypothetical protein